MNTKNKILESFRASKGQIAILIDPEKIEPSFDFEHFVEKCSFAKIDYFFIGGSTVSRQQFEFVIDSLKLICDIPLVIFPGGTQQLSPKADALLYLSLISGRNPDFLIGHHVQSAQEVVGLKIEIIPTGYILIDGNNNSSVAYVSQTTPIPRNKHQIVQNTALAGKLLGKQLLYFDAGSGAKKCIPKEIVVNASELDLPIIVGGGIRTINEITKFRNAGANVIVIGNHIENNMDFLLDIANYTKTTVS